MSTAKATLTISGIDVEVVYKDIKNLHIGVYPPAGRVRVAAPRRFGEDRVRLAVIQRLAWIKQQQKQFQDASRQSEREMVSGESHYVWGIRRLLSVIERPGRAHVEIDHRRLLLYVPEGTGRETREKILQQWQREELRRAVSPLIARWEKEIGRPVTFWGIRRMKTMWGSCNREAARIWLNLELAKKDPACLEYVVVHEMAHLVERGHGERFTKLMDSLLPDWRTRRDTLNRAPLAEETWLSRSQGTHGLTPEWIKRTARFPLQLAWQGRRATPSIVIGAVIADRLVRSRGQSSAAAGLTFRSVDPGARRSWIGAGVAALPFG